VEKAARLEFDQWIKDRYGTHDPELLDIFENENFVEPSGRPTTNDNDGGHHQNDIPWQEVKDDIVRGNDLLQNAEVYLPHGDWNEISRVIGRKRNDNGDYIGRAHSNPILDWRIFMVRFVDGEEKDIAFNVLSEHLYSQVDKEGRQHRIFKEIFNHRKNKNVLDKADGFRLLPNGQQVPKKSESRWDLEAEWKDGTTSWLPLKELKETNGVEVAQYARDNRLLEEPAFAWWAPHYLKRCIAWSSC
jgi:hypothetical protein